MTTIQPTPLIRLHRTPLRATLRRRTSFRGPVRPISVPVNVVPFRTREERLFAGLAAMLYRARIGFYRRHHFPSTMTRRRLLAAPPSHPALAACALSCAAEYHDV